MSGEAVAVLFFLGLAVVGLLWGMAQSSAEREEKANREARRRESVRTKYEGSSYYSDIMAGLIRQGMTGDMVIDAWGRPDAVDRKVYKSKVKEIWKYGPGPRRSFANRVTLENGVVVGWESR